MTKYNSHLASAIDVRVENTQDVLELGRDNERLQRHNNEAKRKKTSAALADGPSSTDWQLIP